MKNILICQHGGSGNHGCEALARAAIQLFKQAEANCNIELFSYRKADDEKYLKDMHDVHIGGLRHLPGAYSPYNLYYHWQKRVIHNKNASKIPLNASFRRAVALADLVVAIGGDNYCYNQGRGYWAHDRYIKEQGKPYILLGASVEPQDLPGELAQHLRLFDLITVREPLSFAALKECGLENTVLCPDAAFILTEEKTRLPAAFKPQDTVGINLSPLIMKSEVKAGITFDNYRFLIKYILANTTMQVALIPHVVWPGNDDRNILFQLKQEFGMEKRIIIIDDHGSRQLKYIISQLRFFVGARTHAIIAAYAGSIPTLAVGYSVKALGIARDIFGYEGGQYVVDVRELSETNQLTQAFIRLMELEDEIRNVLATTMPAYRELAAGTSLYIERLLNGKELFVSASGKLACLSRCTGCGLCAAACANLAITMEAQEEGFLYPHCNNELCIECGKCEQLCPVKKTPLAKPQTKAYAAYNKDEKTRLLSSSGGLFTPLALDVLKYGGYVCGAAYDAQLELRHIIIEDAGDLGLLRGSKYLQSDLSKVYAPLRQILDAELPLLFVGTPCQTAAIRSWCGDHDYLFTVALACHGVPSALLFSKYIDEIEKKKNLKAHYVDFKYKGQGLRNMQIRVHLNGGVFFEESSSESAFMRAFLANLCLRHSCHDCVAKQGDYADLLIGDYWGINKILPGFSDDKGVSVVLVMSEKGQAALMGIKDQLELHETALPDAWAYNPAIIDSAPYNTRRKDFFNRLDKAPLEEVVNSLIGKPAGMQKLLRRLPR
ncbi:MAG: polysaccharide pyruvyl transferase family protein [Firmicutes bacterium]|nr:polysaccharide pyruvyl transferase family protein [Bacillota bacterium]